MELRCPNKKHGELQPSGVIEVKCNSRYCGARPRVVVIHQFDAVTGQLLATKEYRDIPKIESEGLR